MKFDLRLPIGIMFSLFGGMLVIFGLASSRASTVLDININLWWGLVLLAFGALMLAFAWRRRKTPPQQK
jgi:membrane protein implicated in regulation of membrane protease activity